MLSDEIIEKAKNILRANTRVSGNYTYTMPSVGTYPYQWLWDSCFHAIVYSHFDVARGKEEIRSLLSAQFINGFIPHMIYWERGELINIDWGTDHKRSTITQPPMIAYAVWRLFEEDRDVDFLAEVYPMLFRFTEYLLRERDPEDEHILGIINPDESGEDNSPRFDGLLGLPPQHSIAENLGHRLQLVRAHWECKDEKLYREKIFWMKDVPFNAIMLANLGVLTLIASKLGKDKDAGYFKKQKEEIASSMKRVMLEDELYWSIFGENETKIMIKTWAIFTPLFAGILTPDEARRLVDEHLQNPDEFFTEFFLPTVAISEPSFNGKEMWRGPTWIAVNWFVFQGLKQYGFSKEMNLIRDSTIRLLEHSGFREYYDPISGEGYGAEEFTWGALVLDMQL